MLLTNRAVTTETIRRRLARILGSPPPSGATTSEPRSGGGPPGVDDPDEYHPPPEADIARGADVPRTDDDACTEVVATADLDVETVPCDAPKPLVGSAAARGSGVRFDPGRRGLRALVAVVLVVVGIAAVVAWRSRPVPELAPAAPLGRPAAQGSSAAELVVAVVGRVRRPGLVRLPPGARVADAIEKAGGAVPGADLSALNLARRVVDGEKIHVGTPPPPGGGGAAPDQTPGGKVNLNLATVAQLDTLPGVGPVLAERIVEYREKHGGFRGVDELRKVDGIGATRYERLKDLVTV